MILDKFIVYMQLQSYAPIATATTTELFCNMESLFYLFIVSIVREARKHSIVQYQSRAKNKQEKAYAIFKK